MKKFILSISIIILSLTTISVIVLLFTGIPSPNVEMKSNIPTKQLKEL